MAEQQTLFQSSIHGLIYSLDPVDRWIQVKDLTLYIPPNHSHIADTAWVDPVTVDNIYCQEYKYGKLKKLKLKPIAWGFGPIYVNKHRKDEMGSFDFINYEDYLRLKTAKGR